MLKLRAGAGDSASDKADEAIAFAYKHIFCILLDFEMLETRMPFYQSGLGDRLEYERTFNDYNKVIRSYDKNASYNITNICLEFDIVSEIVRLINNITEKWLYFMIEY